MFPEPPRQSPAVEWLVPGFYYGFLVQYRKAADWTPKPYLLCLGMPLSRPFLLVRDKDSNVPRVSAKHLPTAAAMGWERVKVTLSLRPRLEKVSLGL